MVVEQIDHDAADPTPTGADAGAAAPERRMGISPGIDAAMEYQSSTEQRADFRRQGVKRPADKITSNAADPVSRQRAGKKSVRQIVHPCVLRVLVAIRTTSLS